MKREQLIKNYIYAILGAMGEAGCGVSSGHLYASGMSMGVTLEDHNFAVDCAVGIGCVKRSSGHLLTLTPKGEAAAKQINAALANAAASR